MPGTKSPFSFSNERRSLYLCTQFHHWLTCSRLHTVSLRSLRIRHLTSLLIRHTVLTLTVILGWSLSAVSRLTRCLYTRAKMTDSGYPAESPEKRKLATVYLEVPDPVVRSRRWWIRPSGIKLQGLQ